MLGAFFLNCFPTVATGPVALKFLLVHTIRFSRVVVYIYVVYRLHLTCYQVASCDPGLEIRSLLDIMDSFSTNLISQLVRTE